ERYHATFMITVPTAVSALMQRPVDADVSTLNFAISGSAPMPVELFRKFEGATGVTILEGYGLTEATCLVAINPPFGERKIGSVGLPFACTDVHIFHCDAAGNIQKECATDEIGEICVSSPGVVVGEAYTDPEKNKGMYAGGQYLRTGDLGRVDADGYIWITGRAKDLIIRGGHNIDPGTIEEALISHPDVAFAGAIGQPDRYSGELPCAYVELVAGASVDEEALLEYVTPLISEKSAIPKYLKIMPELPKTAVGKVFKPDLRRDAISRVFNQVLANANLDATVSEVVEDKKLGLVAVIAVNNDAITNDILTEVFADYHVPWRLA
ncbi:MAG TPA: AMP-binding protein, partial [Paracoccaceae bacterium]|nr:AMP-binding protein [Paracoccaceae bacterium]